MRRCDAVEKAPVRPPAGSAGGASRPLLALQCVSACAGTTLGSTVGSGTIGKLVTSAGGALITAFLTAPGRRHPRRIVAVGLVLALLQEGKALAATVRHPRAQRAHPSVFPRPAALLVTAAVAVIGFSAGWVVVASPFVASPTSGESAVNVAMRVPKPSSAPARVHGSKRSTGARVTSKPATSSPVTAVSSPPPTHPVRNGTPVNVLGPSGPALVAIPDVAGQSQRVALARLQAAGFTTSTSSQSSATVADGAVIVTNPAGGSRAPAGSSVQVVVCSGPAQVTVPDVAGMPVKSALPVLRGAGFVPAVSLQPSQTVAPGDVIATTPGAGAQAAPASAVAVIVSS